eukprot:CAMPEP_0197051096 /NCGR_PEP_ID=MMETSP1384-20130603/25847_1 /TAXON_ID=29189 /ORGANISM="Ammonia sp." /LENGTH=61 /DNA_ID=CAMNT_0042483603 /DNA_START=8 /DNA_END=190 /DNA_ORIENTATION=+
MNGLNDDFARLMAMQQQLFQQVDKQQQQQQHTEHKAKKRKKQKFQKQQVIKNHEKAVAAVK